MTASLRLGKERIMDLPSTLVLRIKTGVYVPTHLAPPPQGFANCNKMQDTQEGILSGSDLRLKLHWLVV